MNMKILIVDDYKAMLRVVYNLLHQMHFTDIEEARDGAEALEKLRQDTYGLVISDWNMEPMSGIELLKAVRADAKMKDLPFVMVTAESTSDKVIAARKAEVSGYIIKPFTAEALRAKLITILGEF